MSLLCRAAVPAPVLCSLALRWPRAQLLQRGCLYQAHSSEGITSTSWGTNMLTEDMSDSDEEAAAGQSLLLHSN